MRRLSSSLKRELSHSCTCCLIGCLLSGSGVSRSVDFGQAASKCCKSNTANQKGPLMHLVVRRQTGLSELHPHWTVPHELFHRLSVLQANRNSHSAPHPLGSSARVPHPSRLQQPPGAQNKGAYQRRGRINDRLMSQGSGGSAVQWAGGGGSTGRPCRETLRDLQCAPLAT